MKTALVMAACVAATIAVVTTTGSAQKVGKHDAEFRAFYADFVKAVRANDKEKIAGMIAFPVDDWSTNIKHDVQTGPIKDRAEFLARYNVLFTNSMRLHIPKAKVDPLREDRYVAIWREGDIECSFEFLYVAGTGYRIGSYSIGPI